MRKFMITVNGNTYEVDVEEVGGASPAPVAAAPAPAPVAAPIAKPVAAAPAPKSVAPAGAELVKAPMPGTLLKVECAVGQKVKKGQTLFILEAMKMENEIQAPRDCTVVSVNGQKGAQVNAGDPLCAIE